MVLGLFCCQPVIYKTAVFPGTGLRRISSRGAALWTRLSGRMIVGTPWRRHARSRVVWAENGQIDKTALWRRRWNTGTRSGWHCFVIKTAESFLWADRHRHRYRLAHAPLTAPTTFWTAAQLNRVQKLNKKFSAGEPGLSGVLECVTHSADCWLWETRQRNSGDFHEKRLVNEFFCILLQIYKPFSLGRACFVTAQR